MIMIEIKRWISDPTIVSGILSMAGGIIGGFTAYAVAVWQTGKQQKLEKEKRDFQERRKLISDLHSFLDIIASVELLEEQVCGTVSAFRKRTGDGVFNKNEILSGDVINELNIVILQIKQSFNLLEFYRTNIEEVVLPIDDLSKSLKDLLKSHEKVKHMDIKDKTFFNNNGSVVSEDFDEQWPVIVSDLRNAIESCDTKSRELINKLQ